MYDIWCDEVDAQNGKCLLFTVWEKQGPEWKRVYSGYDIDVAASYEKRK